MKHLPMIKLLIAHGANLSIQSSQGLDSLHMACLIGLCCYFFSSNFIFLSGEAAIVFLLLSSNADPNSLDGSGNTPLIAIVKSDLPPVEEIIRLLIRFGADVGAREDGTQNTIFHLLNDHMVSSNILLLLASCSPSMPFTALNSSHLTAFKVACDSLLSSHSLADGSWFYKKRIHLVSVVDVFQSSFVDSNSVNFSYLSLFSDTH